MSIASNLAVNVRQKVYESDSFTANSAQKKRHRRNRGVPFCVDEIPPELVPQELVVHLVVELDLLGLDDGAKRSRGAVRRRAGVFLSAVRAVLFSLALHQPNRAVRRCDF